MVKRVIGSDSSASSSGVQSVTGDAVDNTDPLNPVVTSPADNGGGDYNGPASSVTDEIHTFADTTGKSGKSGSDIVAVGGALQRATPNADLDFTETKTVNLGTINNYAASLSVHKVGPIL